MLRSPAVVLVVLAVAAPAGAEPWTVLGHRGEGYFRFPQAVGLAPDGTVYVGDNFSHVVQAFMPDGTFLREFGSAGSGRGQLAAVGGIAVDASGVVYVADSGNRVERWSADGTFIDSFGTSGSATTRLGPRHRSGRQAIRSSRRSEPPSAGCPSTSSRGGS